MNRRVAWGVVYAAALAGAFAPIPASTIERWYYAARDAADPVLALARKVPSHAGTHPSMPAPLSADRKSVV